MPVFLHESKLEHLLGKKRPRSELGHGTQCSQPPADVALSSRGRRFTVQNTPDFFQALANDHELREPLNPNAARCTCNVNTNTNSTVENHRSYSQNLKYHSHNQNPNQSKASKILGLSLGQLQSTGNGSGNPCDGSANCELEFELEMASKLRNLSLGEHQSAALQQPDHNNNDLAPAIHVRDDAIKSGRQEEQATSNSSNPNDNNNNNNTSSTLSGGVECGRPGVAVAGVGGTVTTVTRDSRKTAPLPRLVGKNGTVNLFLDNIDRRQYMRDLFTTMIDIKWRYNLMAAAFGFVFSWLFFACIWYMVLYVHGDLDISHENDPNWSPCIVNVHSFPAALLFSIETQSTLGFGSRIISVECPTAIVIFCAQLIFGVVIECLIVGMVFAKLSRPAKRSQTIMFSKAATVCLRDNKLCLQFRVGDVRSKSHIIGTTITASLVTQMVTREGETIPFYHRQLDVRIDDSRSGGLLLIWPLIVVHTIDERSPFYQLDAQQLAEFKFEIITFMEGTIESTGQAVQVRSSYLPSEVKWGFRFEPIVSTHGCGRYAQTIIDYNKFNRIVEVDTPQCSARDYYAHTRKLAAREALALQPQVASLAVQGRRKSSAGLASSTVVQPYGIHSTLTKLDDTFHDDNTLTMNDDFLSHSTSESPSEDSSNQSSHNNNNNSSTAPNANHINITMPTSMAARRMDEESRQGQTGGS